MANRHLPSSASGRLADIGGGLSDSLLPPQAGEGPGVRAFGGATFAHRLRAALRTYTTRGVFWLLAAVWLLWFVITAPTRNPASPSAFDLVFYLVISAMFGCAMVKQLKSQFVNPRARLLPHFAAPHLVVAGAMAVAIVVLPALVIASSNVSSGLAMVGLGLALLVFNAWSSYRDDSLLPRAAVIVTMVAGWAAAQYYTDRVLWLLWLGLVDNPIVALGALGIGLAGLGALGVRLWMLSEEMPEYAHHVLGSRSDTTSLVGKRAQRQWEGRQIARSPIMAGLLDVQFRLFLRGAAACRPLRHLFLRRVTQGGFGVLGAPLLLQFTLLMVFASGWPGTSARPCAPEAAPLVAVWVILAAMAFLGASWMRPAPHLARESLYPRGRKGFVRDLICTSTIDTAGLAAGYCGGIIVGLALFASQEPIMPVAVAYLATTLPALLAACGCVPWLASLRSLGDLVVGLIPVGYLSLVLALAADSAIEDLSRPTALAVIAAMTAATLAGVYWSTYWRWCHLDLG
jgi:hypothetical protein